MSTPRELTPEESARIDELIREVFWAVHTSREVVEKIWLAARGFLEGGENKPHLDTADLDERIAKVLWEKGRELDRAGMAMPWDASKSRGKDDTRTLAAAVVDALGLGSES